MSGYRDTSQSARRIIINTNKAPPALGAYNQAVQVGSTLYISGTLGFTPDTMELVGDAVDQTRQALTNMGHILGAANCSFENVVKTTVLLQDINQFAAVNAVYAEFFTTNQPARAAFQVAALPKGAQVEIEAIAVCNIEKGTEPAHVWNPREPHV
eukprot:GFUD01023736.1.p1 GENE.GFUD01023736.1~~GFUD01023736.1.p1  ORF type:complete len:155 (-),score=45.50 GFUD01023736.1:138-602(-)